MAFSAGVFSLLFNWNTDKTNSIKVQANRMQSQEADIATGLSTCILKDGSQTITANIPWNSKLITGLGTATAGDHAMSRDAVIGYAALADADSNIASTTRNALITVALTATRTFTLPAASALPSGGAINVVDVFGGVTSTKAATIARAGSDTIDGLTSTSITSPYGSVTLVSDGTSKWAILLPVRSTLPRGYLAGLATSRASATTYTVAVGTARDDTNAADMTLTSAITKSLSAWAVGSGNGGLDTGAIAASTWYHVYEIMRPDTGVVDSLISLSATAPTMPTNYVFKRRIASILTNGSSQITDYVQTGDRFTWKVPIAAYSSGILSTTAVTIGAGTPTGVKCQAVIRGSMANTAVGTIVLISSLDESDNAPATPAGNFTIIAQVSGTGIACGEVIIMTDTSGNYRIRSSAASTSVNLAAVGWIDSRGQFD